MAYFSLDFYNGEFVDFDAKGMSIDANILECTDSVCIFPNSLDPIDDLNDLSVLSVDEGYLFSG